MPTYDETMQHLNDPDDWDVQGIITGVSKRLRDTGDEHAAAVVDWLRSQHTHALLLALKMEPEAESALSAWEESLCGIQARFGSAKGQQSEADAAPEMVDGLPPLKPDTKLAASFAEEGDAKMAEELT